MREICKLVKERLIIEKISEIDLGNKKSPTELTARDFFCELSVS
jgi:hypothetical protein